MMYLVTFRNGLVLKMDDRKPEHAKALKTAATNPKVLSITPVK